MYVYNKTHKCINEIYYRFTKLDFVPAQSEGPPARAQSGDPPSNSPIWGPPGNSPRCRWIGECNFTVLNAGRPKIGHQLFK